MAQPARPTAARVVWHPIQTAAAVAAGVFLLLGVFGFIPGLTTQLDELAFAGAGSGAMLFGIFQVSVLHNAIHLVVSMVGLGLARSFLGSVLYLGVAGTVYIAVWLYGLFIDMSAGANVLPVNAGHNWLHLGLGAAMLGLVVLRRKPPEVVPQANTSESRT